MCHYRSSNHVNLVTIRANCVQQDANAGHIATGATEAGYKTAPDRIVATCEHDRNCCCRLLGGHCGRGATPEEYRDFLANQVGGQSR